MEHTYLIQPLVEAAINRIKTTFLNYDPADEDHAQSGLAFIEQELRAIDNAYRKIVPIYDLTQDDEGKVVGAVVGYRDPCHHWVAWKGILTFFEDGPLREVYEAEKE